MRILVFLIFSFPILAAHGAGIDNVRMWAAPDRTRVVFDVDEKLEYRIFRMHHPERVVIDFHGTNAPQQLALPSNDMAPVVGLRYARRGKNDLRVVLDLARPLKIQDTLLPPRQNYGHRLVLDLTDRSASQAHRPVVATQKPAVRTDARDIVIAIDAGHGGEDVGAIGPSGVYEKDIVLAVSRRLASLINQYDGMKAVLVREGDYYVGLRQRMLKAREARADLFISIHADAFHDSRVQGSSVYVLSQRGASSEAAHWLAENENASDLIGGVTLDDKDDVLKSVLLDLSQTASLDSSIDAANDVLQALKKLGKVHKRDVQHAGFVVLKSPDIPSLLVETAFISNPSEEKRLRNRKYQARLASSLFNGIRQYFETNTPPGTRLANARRHRVVSGDSLSVIAERYDVSMESIKLANNLRSDGVRTGEVLKIP